MLNKNLYLIPIQSCFITNGHHRASVFDSQNKSILFIPNAMVDFLNRYKKKKIKEILKDFSNSEKEIVLQYIDFMIENGLIYLGKENELNLFLDYNFEWDYPAEISNAVLDISENMIINHFEIIDKLEELNCFHLEIRFSKEFLNKDKQFKLLQYIENKSFHTINVTINYQTSNNQDFFIKLIEKFSKIGNITIYSSPFSKIINKSELFAILNFTQKEFDIIDSCGIIDINFFSLTINHFTESQLHNTCLNRKICIDSEGNIKNCPNMPQSYGNIKDTTLAEAIEKQGFKDCWTICKDKIDVCKDCEFRHICTDCRAFIKDPGNIYSQPAKCGYNPYIAKWQGEEGYVSVEECGTYGKETGFVPNVTKIEKLNREIWEE